MDGKISVVVTGNSGVMIVSRTAHLLIPAVVDITVTLPASCGRPFGLAYLDGRDTPREQNFCYQVT